MKTPARTGRTRSISRRTNFRVLVSSVIVVLALPALGGSPLTADAAKKPGGSGGGPKPGTTQVLPLNLGTVQGCQSSDGQALNAGDLNTLTVAGSVFNCDGLTSSAAARWSYGLGLRPIENPPGSNDAMAHGVSDDGTIVGGMQGAFQRAFVLGPNDDSPVALTGVDGLEFTSAQGISKLGNYIVGTTRSAGTSHATAWSKDGSGAWQPGAIATFSSDSVSVPAVTDQGTAVINVDYADFAAKEAFVAVRDPQSDVWNLVSLGLDYRANDIDPSGNWVVGAHQPCASHCPDQTTPVYWTRAGDGWSDPQPLPLADASGAEALAVAVRNGRLLVVGQGYPKRGSVTRALAWVQGDGTDLTATRLAAIGGNNRWWAVATDVNENGFVTGWSQGSSTGYTDFAVLWQLP